MDPVDHHASAGAYGHYASYGSPVVAQVGGPGAGAPHLPGGPASLPGGTDASGPGVASCLLFEFVLHLVLCGALCLLGFVGNGVSFAALWNQQRHPTAVTFLLQGAIIADLGEYCTHTSHTRTHVTHHTVFSTFCQVYDTSTSTAHV